jgi:hypothetical protein
MNNRVLRFYNLWYKKPRYHMSWQDWLYCGLVIWLSTMGFAVGFIAGSIWTLFI